MRKRVLVTSGGTSEPIDQVRKITNLSTGRLGSLIADTLTQSGIDVDYMHGEMAAIPSLQMAGMYCVDSVHTLQTTLQERLAQQSYDAVVHAMAVSDYTPRAVLTAQALAEDLAQRLHGYTVSDAVQLVPLIQESILRCRMETGQKIRSDLDNMLLLLERTPKIIGQIKQYQPETSLIGFKLLSGVEESTLLQVAQALLVSNGCDYVVANDQQTITHDAHHAILVNRAGICRRMSTKQEIAGAIAEIVIKG